MKSFRSAALLLVFGALSKAPRLTSQERETISPERLAAREWFRDAKFGMFIHWGVYSQLGNGEWVMQNRGIRLPEYEWLAANFNPAKFNAEEWVTTALRAAAAPGMSAATLDDCQSSLGSSIVDRESSIVN